MHWVLIILITANGRPAVSTAEFADELLCKTAATAVKIEAAATLPYSTKIVATCFATGVP